MITKVFKFNCKKCGMYSVQEKTFLTLVVSSLKNRIDHLMLDPKVKTIVANWNNKCPRCAHTLPTDVSISVS